MLDANAALLEAMRRLTTLAERLLSRVTLTDAEAQDAKRELDAARDGIERIDALLTLRRQQMRPM